MKIKSLLLGSAAALLAVTGVQAADPVMVEAEPVDYVRVCDAYGSGFFYIPGTETCLKFSGYVRIDYQSRHFHEDSAKPTGDHSIVYRGRLNIDARNETEWGTLRSQLRLQGDGGQGYGANSSDSISDGDGMGDGSLGIDRALISIAGFNLGYSDNYWTTVGGYGYYNARNDGIYGYTQGIFLDYTYKADGLSLTAGIEANGNSGSAGQPDLYAGATYSGSWGRIYGVYYHDAQVSNGAWKAGAELSLADYVPGGAIKGWYMSDDGETDYVKGHAWGVSAKMSLTDSLTLYAGYSDYNDEYFLDDKSTWTAGVRWNAAPGLSIQTEYVKDQYVYETEDHDSGSTGYYGIRVVRSF